MESPLRYLGFAMKKKKEISIDVFEEKDYCFAISHQYVRSDGKVFTMPLLTIGKHDGVGIWASFALFAVLNIKRVYSRENRVYCEYIADKRTTSIFIGELKSMGAMLEFALWSKKVNEFYRDRKNENND